MSILITGGAGYIGSHTVWALYDLGLKPIVLDNLYSGFRWALPPDIEFIQGDVGDQNLVREVFKKHHIQSIIHFAAHLEVEESTQKPLKYYDNNSIRTRYFIESAMDEGVKHFIFSSTSAAYGNPTQMPVTEDAPCLPVSPYGKSKLISEWVLQDLAAGTPPMAMTFAILRYFNVAGADPLKRTGQSTRGATQLVKVAAEVALGKRPHLNIFGSDYPTSDGTCVRDYIHVSDLAQAHLVALDHLKNNGASGVFNAGYGHGFSVLEVVNAMKKVSGVDFKCELAPRRAGDAVAIWSDPTRLKSLGWTPKHEQLEKICQSALEWDKHLAQLKHK